MHHIPKWSNQGERARYLHIYEREIRNRITRISLRIWYSDVLWGFSPVLCKSTVSPLQNVKPAFGKRHSLLIRSVEQFQMLFNLYDTTYRLATHSEKGHAKCNDRAKKIPTWLSLRFYKKKFNLSVIM